jgi:hypothetical protein
VPNVLTLTFIYPEPVPDLDIAPGARMTHAGYPVGTIRRAQRHEDGSITATVVMDDNDAGREVYHRFTSPDYADSFKVRTDG